MAELTAACPSFAGAWADYRAEWADDPDPHPFLETGRFANHLVDLLERGEVVEMPTVFEAVERLLVDDDAGVRDLVKIGLIESLGNVASNRHGWRWAARFRDWLGPRATEAWEDIHRMWGTSDAG
ncbi:MAG TPA: hypothetical protein VFI34_11085 [Candidatus Limnocylindrales bacterium]|nr:hypothetical protein [Candidatus Limnocylindrales bacterium]